MGNFIVRREYGAKSKAWRVVDLSKAPCDENISYHDTREEAQSIVDGLNNKCPDCKIPLIQDRDNTLCCGNCDYNDSEKAV